MEDEVFAARERKFLGQLMFMAKIMMVLVVVLLCLAVAQGAVDLVAG